MIEFFLVRILTWINHMKLSLEEFTRIFGRVKMLFIYLKSYQLVDFVGLVEF